MAYVFVPARHMAAIGGASGLRILHQAPGGILGHIADRLVGALDLTRVRQVGPPWLLMAGHTTVDLRRPVPVRLELSPIELATWPQHIVQFRSPPPPAAIDALRAAGAEVITRLGDYGAAVRCPRAVARTIAGDPQVRRVLPFLPSWKLSSNLKGRHGVVYHVWVGVRPPDAAPAVAQAVLGLGGRVVAHWDEQSSPGDGQAVLIAAVEASKLLDLAHHPDVSWLDHAAIPFADLCEKTVHIAASADAGVLPPSAAPHHVDTLSAWGLSGAGVTIAINDTGVDTEVSATLIPPLNGRLVWTNATPGQTDLKGHGTMIATLAAGAGGEPDSQGYELGIGMAPGASLASIRKGSAAEDPEFTGYADTTFAAWIGSAAIAGASVINMSYALNEAGNKYSGIDQILDERVRDASPGVGVPHPMLAVVAAGNEKTGAGSLRAQAKNAVIVGSSLGRRPDSDYVAATWEDIRTVGSASSRGPAKDGRTLPTLVAPGRNVVSARSASTMLASWKDEGGSVHTQYTMSSGSSHAAPHVSGAAALLIQWWRDRTGVDPSPAMLKALLIAGAVDGHGGRDGDPDVSTLTLGHRPDNSQGWGRVNVKRSLFQLPGETGERLFVDQRVSLRPDDMERITPDPSAFAVRVSVVDPALPLRVFLVWTDAAKDPMDGGVDLVNDLDLHVTSSSASEGPWHGNHFDAATGLSAVGGSPDATNNVEVVCIQGAIGVLTVQVIGKKLVADAAGGGLGPNQDFALILENAAEASGDPVDVVLLVDRSGSMVSSAYDGVTRTAAHGLLDRLRVDDQCAILSFGTGPIHEHPVSGLTTVSDAASLDPAHDAIDLMAFGGSTFMGEGLAAAQATFGAGTHRKAIVMLSDGYPNGVVDPMSVVGSLGGAQLHTCAMGPLSDSMLLAGLAAATGGRFFYMPTIDDLFLIMGFITAHLQFNGVIVNANGVASSARVPVPIDPSVEQAGFCVSWADPGLRWVAGAPSGLENLSIRLIQPGGQHLHPDSCHVRARQSPGNLLLEVADPRPGTWWIEVETTLEAHTAFTATVHGRSPIGLDLPGTPPALDRGQPVLRSVRVRGVQDPVAAGLRVTARTWRPAASVVDIVRGNKGPLLQPDGDGGMPRSVASLAALIAAARAEGRSSPYKLATRDQVLAHRAGGVDERGGWDIDTLVAGPRLAILRAAGVHPSGYPFQRLGSSSYVIRP